MISKFSGLFAAVAIVSCAAPVYASAAPELTINGAKPDLGASVTATSTNHVRKTVIGNITCATVAYHLEVTANTGSTIELKGAGAGTTATCFFKGTTPITIDDPTVTKLHLGEAGKGTANVTWISTLPKGLTCHHLGTNMPVTYTATSNTIRFAGPITMTPEACGTGFTEADFTLTSSGGPVVLH